MPGIYRYIGFSATFLLGASAWSVGPCDQPRTDAEISQCLAIELQKVYATHSVAHRSLTATTPAMPGVEYRNRENVWEKARNAKCEVDVRGPDLSAWLRVVAETPRKVTCVIRETREHQAQLEKPPIAKGEQANNQAPASEPAAKTADFVWISPVARSTGKWYFEVSLDKDGLTRTQDGVRDNWPMAMWIGCTDAKRSNDIGTLIQIRPRSAQIPETLGLALDLDRGKLFISRNGLWQGSVTDSRGGRTIKQGLSYVCGLESTLVIRSLLENNAVNVNLGEMPFRFSMPMNYRPFQTGS